MGSNKCLCVIKVCPSSENPIKITKWINNSCGGILSYYILGGIRPLLQFRAGN